MAEKRKMSLKPPKTSIEDKIQAFIDEPEKKLQKDEEGRVPEKREVQQPQPPPKKTDIKAPYPWEEPGVTPEIIKPFVLRLKQPDKLKAEYIVQNSLDYRSLQDYCMKAILKQIDKDLKKQGI